MPRILGSAVCNCTCFPTRRTPHACLNAATPNLCSPLLQNQLSYPRTTDSPRGGQGSGDERMAGVERSQSLFADRPTETSHPPSPPRSYACSALASIARAHAGSPGVARISPPSGFQPTSR